MMKGTDKIFGLPPPDLHAVGQRLIRLEERIGQVEKRNGVLFGLYAALKKKVTTR